MDTKWDTRFIDLAKLIASWSKDPSTQVGAVIVKGKKIVSVGYNGFPEGVEDKYELLKNRDEKYPRIVHAEANAIITAKRDLSDCSIYVHPFPPCSTCSGLIIQAGIRRVVATPLTEEQRQRWGKDMQRGLDMFKEVGIEYVEL